MRRLRPRLIAAGLALAVAAPLAAEAQSRAPWLGDNLGKQPLTLVKNKATKPDPMKKLVGDIKALIDKAERERTADPKFLKELRAAIRPHQPYWATSLVDENFSDGDYTKNPSWTPVRGRFRMDKVGLTMSPNVGQPGQEVAAQLLKGLLGGKVQTSTGSGALIALDGAVPNIYGLDVIMRVAEVRSANEAAMRIGMTQGADRRGGYWVVVEPGAQPTVGLYALTRAGLNRLGVARIEGELLTGQDVRVQWQRREKGLIRVFVNRKKLIEARDETFRQQFDSLVLASDGMDSTVRRVRAVTR